MNLIGDRIKQRRKALKITQRELAEKLGVSAPSVTQWETNKTEPTGLNITYLSIALKCTPIELAGGSDDKMPSETKILHQIAIEASELDAEGRRKLLNIIKAMK